MGLGNVIGQPMKWTRSLYDWVLSWGDSKHGGKALFVMSLAEASFFPIPPDALLIGLCMGAHKRWMRFALICSVGSVIGGALGYWIGYAAFEFIGESILSFVASISGTNSTELLNTAQYWFNEKEIWGQPVGPWAVGVAGFTPIPYKVFTIASGFFEMSFLIFMIASVISRSARFFIVAGLIGLLFEKYGDRIKQIIDKYFNLLAIAFMLLLIAGFWTIKLVSGNGPETVTP